MPIYLLPSPCIYTHTDAHTLLTAVTFDTLHQTDLKSGVALRTGVASGIFLVRVDDVCFLTFLAFKHTHRVLVKELELA